MEREEADAGCHLRFPTMAGRCLAPLGGRGEDSVAKMKILSSFAHRGGKLTSPPEEGNETLQRLTDGGGLNATSGPL